jgi:hypothetical protein
MPPPIPKRPDPPAARSGEMVQATPALPRPPSGAIEAIPSVMLGTPASTRIQLANLDNVLDLSSNVGADSWMADGGTDLLSAHRWKSLRNFAIAIAVLAVVGIGIFFVVSKTSTHEQRVIPPPPADAAVVKVAPPPIDAGDEINHDDIVALSKYGFFSIAATAKTTIYVDDKYIGETPLTRLPLKPGPHSVKAVGPRGKSKKLTITIIGGRDDDEGTITW